jgi:hypothetical protein
VLRTLRIHARIRQGNVDSTSETDPESSSIVGNGTPAYANQMILWSQRVLLCEAIGVNEWEFVTNPNLTLCQSRFGLQPSF